MQKFSSFLICIFLSTPSLLYYKYHVPFNILAILSCHLLLEHMFSIYTHSYSLSFVFSPFCPLLADVILSLFAFPSSLSFSILLTHCLLSYSFLLFAFLLKGTVSRDFCFWFFSWISFPQASDYTIRAVSNFFEISRRFSQLKVWKKNGKNLQAEKFQ